MITVWYIQIWSLFIDFNYIYMWNEVLVELTGSGSWLISKRYSLHICYSTILYSRQLCQEKNARRSHDLFIAIFLCIHTVGINCRYFRGVVRGNVTILSVTTKSAHLSSLDAWINHEYTNPSILHQVIYKPSCYWPSITQK